MSQALKSAAHRSIVVNCLHVDNIEAPTIRDLEGQTDRCAKLPTGFCQQSELHHQMTSLLYVVPNRPTQGWMGSWFPTGQWRYSVSENTVVKRQVLILGVREQEPLIRTIAISGTARKRSRTGTVDPRVAPSKIPIVGVGSADAESYEQCVLRSLYVKLATLPYVV